MSSRNPSVLNHSVLGTVIEGKIEVRLMSFTENDSSPPEDGLVCRTVLLVSDLKGDVNRRIGLLGSSIVGHIGYPVRTDGSHSPPSMTNLLVESKIPCSSV